MKEPIIITEQGDISVHPTIKHAEEFLEPVDIRDGTYEVYDSEGFQLDLTVQKIEQPKRFLFVRWIERVERGKIADFNPRRDRAAELREKLTRYLAHRGKPLDEIQPLTTEALIRLVAGDMPWKMPDK